MGFSFKSVLEGMLDFFNFFKKEEKQPYKFDYKKYKKRRRFRK